MSWDIFVQDLPPGITTVADIPDGFLPRPIGRRADIVAGITDVSPTADFTDPAWGKIDADSFSIEINLSLDDPVRSFAFHISGSHVAADVVADILDRLQLQALDLQAPGGLFTRQTATSSMDQWQQYRDEAIDP